MLDSPEMHIPAFDDDELDQMLARTKTRSGVLRARRRRHRFIATAGLMALTLALAGTVVSLQSAGRSRASAPRTGTRQVAAPRWRLVSDVTPGWQTLTGLGYEPGFFLQCPTATTCYADDLQGSEGTYSELEVTNDGGTTWRPSKLPVALSDATVACADADTCAALGVDGSGEAMFLETTDGGQTWTSSAGPSLLTSSIGVTDLSCTAATSCVAVASDPFGRSGTTVAFVTGDGGATWTESNLPSDFVPSDLQCFSSGTCVSTGFYQSPGGSPTTPPGTVLYRTDGGSTWTSASVPSGLGPLSSLSSRGRHALRCQRLRWRRVEKRRVRHVRRCPVVVPGERLRASGRTGDRRLLPD